MEEEPCRSGYTVLTRLQIITFDLTPYNIYAPLATYFIYLWIYKFTNSFYLFNHLCIYERRHRKNNIYSQKCLVKKKKKKYTHASRHCFKDDETSGLERCDRIFQERFKGIVHSKSGKEKCQTFYSGSTVLDRTLHYRSLPHTRSPPDLTFTV